MIIIIITKTTTITITITVTIINITIIIIKITIILITNNKNKNKNLMSNTLNIKLTFHMKLIKSQNGCINIGGIETLINGNSILILCSHNILVTSNKCKPHSNN